MKTILFVDGSESNWLLLHEELSEEGYKVVTANDNEEVLSRFTEFNPDLITLEVRQKNAREHWCLQQGSLMESKVLLKTEFESLTLKPPAPELSEEVIQKKRQKYLDAYERLVERDLSIDRFDTKHWQRKKRWKLRRLDSGFDCNGK